MRLIIGLGNPIKGHEKNRHNVGHRFVDFVDEKIKTIKSINEIKAIKTDCFMNDSGKYIKWAINNGQWAITDLCIVHDDLDLAFGQFKIQLGVGPKVHNGVISVEEALGTKNFWRVRIGVDNRDPKSREIGEKYVLENFTPEEEKKIPEIFQKVYEALVKHFSGH